MIFCSYYSGTHGVFLVYDISDRDTYDSIEKWLKKKERYAPKNVVTMLLGNKCDLEDERKVTTDEGQKYAGENVSV